MSDKETPREENAAAEEATGKLSGDEGAKRPADQHHGHLVEFLKQSLTAEGEPAYQRWGLPLFHSMSDEDAEAQRAALGFAPADALDFYNRGCLLASREDFSAAAKAFERAFQLDGQLAEAAFNRAAALEKAGDSAKAREAWQLYLERFGDNEDAVEVKEHLSAAKE